MIAIAALLLSMAASAPAGQTQVASTAQPPTAAQQAKADAYYRFLDARQHEMDGDIDGAIKLYQEASRLDPSSGAILAELAGLYARQDRLKDAVSTAEAALQVNKDTVEAHALLGSIYAAYAQEQGPARTSAANAAQQDYAKRAIGHFEAVLAARGATAGPDLLLTLGRLYVKTSAPDKAIPLLARFAQQEPDAMEGVALLAEAYTEAGRVDEATALLEKSANREPSFYPVLGQIHERAGRWSAAADAYQKAVQRGTNSPEVKRRLAVALLNAGRPGDATRALDLLRQMIRDNPKDPQTLYLLAQAQSDANDHQAAEATARQLVDVAPNEARSYVALAQVLASADRAAQAEPVLQQARARFPNDVAVLFELGAVYDREKKYAEAEDAFKQVLTHDPLHAQALNYLGYMLAERGVRLQESVGYIQRALAVDPKNPAYLDSLGWAYYKMNRLDLAESNLRQAAADRPNDSAVQDHWGDLLLKLGRRGEAIAAWRRALAGDGQDIDRTAVEAKIRASEKAGKQ